MGDKKPRLSRGGPESEAGAGHQTIVQAAILRVHSIHPVKERLCIIIMRDKFCRIIRVSSVTLLRTV